jgi:hypothetical protein
MWSEDGALNAPTSAGGEILYDKVARLSPKNDTERSLKGHALSIVMDIGKARWLMFEQATISVFMPFAGRADCLAKRHFRQFRPLRPL